MLQHFRSYKLQIYLGFRVMSSLEFQFEFGNQGLIFFIYWNNYHIIPISTSYLYV